MFLTIDILLKRGACEPGIKFFERHYPNGAELIDLINNRLVTSDFLHWGYLHLDPNEEEIAAYWKRLDVDDPSTIFCSERVKNSYNVTNSSDVENSHSVYYSKKIKRSSVIQSGDNVEDSTNIFNSKFIYNSYNILNSSNITNSHNVFQGTYIVDSSSVWCSSVVNDSRDVRGCHNVSDVRMCAASFNLNHALFCEGLTEGEYMLFNKPIPQKQFELIKRQYDNLMQKDLVFSRDDWPQDTTFPETPRPCHNYSFHYSKVSKDFWEWVTTLPNFNPKIMYKLTFNSDFL